MTRPKNQVEIPFTSVISAMSTDPDDRMCEVFVNFGNERLLLDMRRTQYEEWKESGMLVMMLQTLHSLIRRDTNL